MNRDVYVFVNFISFSRKFKVNCYGITENYLSFCKRNKFSNKQF